MEQIQDEIDLIRAYLEAQKCALKDSETCLAICQGLSKNVQEDVNLFLFMAFI